MPRTFPGLETQRLLIRHFVDEDLPTLLAYRNEPEAIRFQKWESMSEDLARIFIDEMKEANPGVPGHWFQFAVQLKEGGAHIGDCALHTRGDDGRLGEVGYTIAQPYRRQGYASEAVAAILDYAFVVLRMHRITATVDTRNERSIALLERLGFRREGEFLSCSWFREAWCDEYLYAILDTEWTTRQKGTHNVNT